MPFTLRPMTGNDRLPVIDIFNYYIENSFAAYPEKKVPYDFFDILLKTTEGYPTLVVADEQETVVGFGLIRPYLPFSVFSKTAEISYFLKPEWTGRGLGNLMLIHLTRKATHKGITSLLASISSLNPMSIRFHQKNGFLECGRFQKIGEKHGQVFDVLYMQKTL